MYFPAIENVTSVIVKKIEAEGVRIAMSAWYLTDGLIVNALLKKHSQGVPIRLIGDRESIFKIDAHTKNAFYRLANAGVPIRLRVNHVVSRDRPLESNNFCRAEPREVTGVTFATSGPQTMRIQVREDGVMLDQIVLSPQTFMNTAPGSVGGDNTFVPKP